MELKKLRKLHAQKSSLNHDFNFERQTKEITLLPNWKIAETNNVLEATILKELRGVFRTLSNI